jgi:hypothetical protein
MTGHRCLALWLTLAGTGPVAAQSPLRLEAGATAGIVRLRTIDGPIATRRTGVSLGGQGAVWWNRLGLEGGYLEGRLGSDGSRLERVEGYAMLGVSPVRGLVINVGPLVRALVTGAATTRWVLWNVKTRYEVGIVGRFLSGFGEAWGAVKGSSNVPETFNSARGGMAGLALAVGNGQAIVRLSYGIDESRLGAGRRRDTIETFAIGTTIRIR